MAEEEKDVKNLNEDEVQAQLRAQADKLFKEKMLKAMKDIEEILIKNDLTLNVRQTVELVPRNKDK